MRKKYLSALLFGALLFASAGTFTSCKDYDDDIDNLQSQIDKLATKEDMTAKLSQMETAVSDAKASAQSALTKAQEALTKAEAAGNSEAVKKNTEEIATLKEKVATLEKTLGDIEKLKKDIQDALDEQISDFRKEMEKLLKQVEELTGYSLDMLTGISFEGEEEENGQLDLGYARVAEINYPKGLLAANNNNETNRDKVSSYEFGKGLAGAFTVNAKDVNTVADGMLVKVDPVDATISSDMLSLVNGKGENLNAYLDMTSSAYSENFPITRPRTASNTGLRWVTAQLKSDVDFEAFDKLVLSSDGEHAHASEPNNCAHDHNYIAYALAVTDASKDRTVTSPFDISIHVVKEGRAEAIAANSRLSSSAAALTHQSNSAINKWTNGEDATDDEKCFPVTNGETFDLSVSSTGGRVMGSYVVVDIDNASLSITDKAAIKGLTISGVNEVSKDLHHSLSINGTAGIPVPLKLVTIDYTGYVKVNVFWVKAGDAALMNASFIATPTEFVADPKAYPCDNIQAFTVPAGTTQYSIDITVGEAAHEGDNHVPTRYRTQGLNAIDATLQAMKFDANNTSGLARQNVLTLLKADKTSSTANPAEVKYAQFVGKINLQMMKEDKEYTGIVRFYNATGTYLGCNTIQLTKKLPTAVPADFSAKTNGIVNGIMTIYPEPTQKYKYDHDTWTADGDNKAGIYYLDKAFNNWEKNFELSIKDGKGLYDNNGTITGTHNNKACIWNIATGAINDGNAYETTIKYNYGEILYIPEGHGVDTPEPYKVTWGTNYSTKFGCWPVDSKYSWSETPTVYYRQENIIKGKVTKNDLGKVTAFENVIKAISPYNHAIDPFDGTDTNWTTWANAFNIGGNQNVEIILITNNNGTDVENEFFTAKFEVVSEGGISKNAMKLTPTAAEVAVGADVETKVILKITDKFGHTHKIPALTFIMKINGPEGE